MKQRLISLFVLISIFLSLPIVALSADFTFFIGQIKITAMPTTAWPVIVCEVLNQYSQVIGGGVTEVTLNNNGYLGPITVTVNTAPTNPSDAKKWICQLKRRVEYSNLYSSTPLSCDGGSGTYDKAPNTTCRVAVAGDITQ
jgi:hypothetical protein